MGGTGFIGFHLAKKCLKKGWSVTSLSRRKANKKRFIKQVDYIRCDITKKNELIKKINKNYEYVINLGGNVDHSNSQETYISHYIGLKNLVKIFSNKNLRRFVQIGSGGEYGNAKVPHKENSQCKPSSIYYKSKYLSTLYLLKQNRKKKFPATILRLYQAYGPKQDINRLIPIVIKNCIKDKKFKCTSGKQFRDFIFIDDVVNAIIKSLLIKNAIGEVFNLGTGNFYQVKKIIEYIRIRVKKGFPLYGSIRIRNDELNKVYPSIKKIYKKLKWKPKFSLTRGLSKTINHYKKQNV